MPIQNGTTGWAARAGLEHGDRARRARARHRHGRRRGAAQVALAQSRRLNRGRRLRRQWEGDDIDLNAAIEVLVDRRLDLAPDARLFMRPGRQPCRCATLVLLDLSESANDLAAPGGPTVLDLEKRAALLLAGSLAGSGDGVAVHGFRPTRGRRWTTCGCWISANRRWGRPPAASSRPRVRPGWARRCATPANWRCAPTRRHAIVVVTDGEPSDVDVHDPRYLVEDARAAALALRRRGLRVHCLALDARRAAAARHVRRGRLPARDQSGPAGRRAGARLRPHRRRLTPGILVLTPLPPMLKLMRPNPERPARPREP